MRFFITFFLALSAMVSFSQSEPLVAAYWNNYSMFNPAHTGLDYDYYGAVNQRSSFQGINGGPSLWTAQVEANVEDINSGIGIGYLRERYGWSKLDKAYLNYAYHYEIEENKLLSFGTSIRLDRLDESDLWIDFMDPFAPSPITLTSLNFNVGTAYKTEKLELGLSATQIRNVIVVESKLYVTTYFAYASYNFDISEKVSCTPSAIFRMYEGINTYEANARFDYGKYIWGGITYRKYGVFAFQAGGHLADMLTVGYSYEPAGQDEWQYAGSSHDFMLSVGIGKRFEEQ